MIPYKKSYIDSNKSSSNFISKIFLKSPSNISWIKIFFISKIFEECWLIATFSPNANQEKISIKYQVMAYTLLEKLVNHTIKDAGSIIQEAQSKAEDLLLKLCL